MFESKFKFHEKFLNLTSLIAYKIDEISLNFC